jgi:hypothetical protein
MAAATHRNGEAIAIKTPKVAMLCGLNDLRSIKSSLKGIAESKGNHSVATKSKMAMQQTETLTTAHICRAFSK